MHIVEEIRQLLAAGKVNPNDLWHANDLVNCSPGDSLTQGNLNWLASLAKRGGGPFKSNP